MYVANLVFNFVEENTYILWDDTKECVVVDAGNSRPEEDDELRRFISERGLKVVMAINTHGHFDHAMGVEFVRREYGVPFAMSSRDQYLLDGQPSGSVVYGMKLGDMPSKIDIDLDGLEQVSFGETTLRVLPSAGHTKGHVLLFDEAGRRLFTGDTLFRESIGRTDLPGGDYVALMQSITQQILPLGDDVEIYCGHGEKSTIGHESLYNPFVVEVISGEIKP